MPRPLPQIPARTLALAKRGDADAHAEIYAAYAPFVFTLARRILGSTALAEDALQETFLEIIRKIGAFRGDAELGAWIRRIAINRCLMHVRSAWAARRIDREHFDDAAAAATDPGARIELERALDALAPRTRAVVWLHDVEGFTHREIGKLMGRSASFSKSQLARAHERLRELLEEDDREGETLLCDSALKTC